MLVVVLNYSAFYINVLALTAVMLKCIVILTRFRFVGAIYVGCAYILQCFKWLLLMQTEQQLLITVHFKVSVLPNQN